MRPRAMMMAGLVPVMLMVGGCQDPSYEAARACSIPTDTVAAVIGTERFTAADERIDGLPFTATSTQGSAACHADTDDVTFTTRALVVPAAEARQRTAAIQEQGDEFALAGGVARADGRQGAWVCGSVWVTVWLDGDRTAEAADMRSALESVVQEATCYTAASAE